MGNMDRAQVAYERAAFRQYDDEQGEELEQDDGDPRDEWDDGINPDVQPLVEGLLDPFRGEM